MSEDRARMGITVTLERRVFVKHVDLPSDAALRWLAPQVAEDWDGYERRLIHEVYAEPIQRVRVEYPRDWWAAFKDRWFPAWAKRRWPPAMEVIDLDAAAYVPGIAISGRRYTNMITGSIGGVDLADIEEGQRDV